MPYRRFAVLLVFVACREQIVEGNAKRMRETRSTCAARHCRVVCAAEKEKREEKKLFWRICSFHL
jgi:hypothetical protein